MDEKTAYPCDGTISQIVFRPNKLDTGRYIFCVMKNGEEVPGSEIIVDLTQDKDDIVLIPEGLDVKKGDALSLRIDPCPTGDGEAKV